MEAGRDPAGCGGYGRRAGQQLLVDFQLQPQVCACFQTAPQFGGVPIGRAVIRLIQTCAPFGRAPAQFPRPGPGQGSLRQSLGVIQQPDLHWTLLSAEDRRE